MNISNNLLQAIANYLASKPYFEVVWLINALQQEVNVVPSEPVKEVKTEEETK
jgi:hypothetical protein